MAPAGVDIDTRGMQYCPQRALETIGTGVGPEYERRMMPPLSAADQRTLLHGIRKLEAVSHTLTTLQDREPHVAQLAHVLDFLAGEIHRCLETLRDADGGASSAGPHQPRLREVPHLGRVHRAAAR
jgi:hypothetical protein